MTEKFFTIDINKVLLYSVSIFTNSKQKYIFWELIKIRVWAIRYCNFTHLFYYYC